MTFLGERKLILSDLAFQLAYGYKWCGGDNLPQHSPGSAGRQTPGGDEAKLVDQVVAVLDGMARRLLDQDDLLLLTGGLDSRLVAAAYRRAGGRFRAANYNFPGNDASSALARRIAATLELPIDILAAEPPLTFSGWPSAVRATRGEVSVNHLHMAGILDSLKALGSRLHISYLLGATLGGTYFSWADPRADEERLFQAALEKYRVIDDATVEKAIGREGVEFLRGDFRDQAWAVWERCRQEDPLDTLDLFITEIYGKQKIASSNYRYLQSRFDIVLPALDEELLHLTDQIPWQWRRNHRFFRKVLRAIDPRMMQIPSNHTGLPLHSPGWMNRCGHLVSRVRARAGRKATQLTHGGWAPLANDYPDYGEWLRLYPEGRSLVETRILSGDASWRKVLRQDFIDRSVQDFLAYRFHNAELIFTLLTLEMREQKPPA